MLAGRAKRTRPIQRHSPYARFQKLRNRKGIAPSKALTVNSRRTVVETKSIWQVEAIQKEFDSNGETGVVAGVTNGGDVQSNSNSTGETSVVAGVTNGGDVQSSSSNSTGSDVNVTSFEAPFENGYLDLLLQYDSQFSGSHSDTDGELDAAANSFYSSLNGSRCLASSIIRDNGSPETTMAENVGTSVRSSSLNSNSTGSDVNVTYFEAPFENGYYDRLLQYDSQFSDSHSDTDSELDASANSFYSSLDDSHCLAVSIIQDDGIPEAAIAENADTSLVLSSDNLVNGESEGLSSKAASESPPALQSDASFKRENLRLLTGDEDDGFIAICKNSRFFQLNTRGTFLLTMEHPSAVPILGRVNVRCVWGLAKINGYILKPDVVEFLPVCSIGALGQMVLRTIGDANSDSVKSIRKRLRTQTGNKAIIASILKSYSPTTVAVMFQRLRLPLYAYLRRTHKSLFEKPPHISYVANTSMTTQYDFTLEMRASNSVKWDSSRENVLKDVRDFMLNSASPPRVIVCGGSNVGKSTFCRHLVNSLLNTCSRVSWLDCDPGQSEFTPHGLVSVVEIDEPLLGPAFSHQKTAKRMYFVGGTSVADSPEHYMACVAKLFEYWSLDSDLCQQPLLVNTMGWRRGLGIMLLAEIIRLIRPTHVVQISMPVHPSRNMPSLTPQFVAESDGLATCRLQNVTEDRPLAHFDYRHYDIVSLVNIQLDTPKTFILRDVAMVAYFSRLHQDGRFLPLNECSCYSIPWSALALHACNQHVPKSEILYVMNGNVVALCECKPEEMMSMPDETLPKFVKETPVGVCFGYGIVRAVSMAKKCLYVITPVEPQDLRRVNALLSGSGVHVPIGFLKRQTVSSHLPYLTVHKRPVPFTITNRHIGPRKFKKRRKRAQ